MIKIVDTYKDNQFKKRGKTQYKEYKETTVYNIQTISKFINTSQNKDPVSFHKHLLNFEQKSKTIRPGVVRNQNGMITLL